MGNLIPRHLGIPTVTLPMGLLSDIAMPVGVTIAGSAYRDVELLRIAAAVEKLSSRRARPPLTPKLADEAPFSHVQKVADGNITVTVSQVSVEQKGEASLVRVTASLDTPEKVDVTVFIAGKRAPATVSDNGIVTAEASMEEADFTRRHSEWREPYGPLVVVIARSESGAVAGSWGTTPDSPL
jgi:amidase